MMKRLLIFVVAALFAFGCSGETQTSPDPPVPPVPISTSLATMSVTPGDETTLMYGYFASQISIKYTISEADIAEAQGIQVFSCLSRDGQSFIVNSCGGRPTRGRSGTLTYSGTLFGTSGDNGSGINRTNFVVTIMFIGEFRYQNPGRWEIPLDQITARVLAVDIFARTWNWAVQPRP